MAAIVYFSKAAEDDKTIRYSFGTDSLDMTRALMVDKAGDRVRPEDGREDYHFRKAAAKILSLHRERGTWPDRGMHVS